jgi:NAD(P)-dependent dehydrogenase (short-subunit alcohol dehydrogenase family)
MARVLRLHEDLTEALALMHDIGHPPYGHCGEDALSECMESIGGFSHNEFALVIVQELEQRYGQFSGLNLSQETLAGQDVRAHKAEAADGRSPMLEVQLVNSVAPFVLCNRLVHLMKKENTGMKHIINVSAMEGKFHKYHKESRHPHTNMAKAALNMMTLTSAGDFAKYGIYTNAVDTGWVTDEDPVELAKRKEKIHDFQPPLDIVDGAARVMDPLFDGINTGKHWCGKFLKDYRPISW